MLIAYKYRLYPNPGQTEMLNKHFGCVRWTWNWALAQKVERYERDGERLSVFDLKKRLPELKQEPDTEWLGEVNSQSLQEALVHLDKAFTRFFKGDAASPRFKSKRGKNSFACPQNVVVNFDAGKVRLPKIGWVKAKLSRRFGDEPFEGKIKTCTVTTTTTGKVFISAIVDDSTSPPEKAPIREGTAVGVDLGIESYAVLSTGEEIPNPRHLEEALGRLRVLQRRLSKKQKGSQRRGKARQAVALQHEKVRGRRQDFLHKLTTKIVREHDTICLETLNVAGMVKNRSLARHISQAGWSEFVRMILYKAERAGKNVLRIGQFEPSSQTCACGAVNGSLTLRDRQWTCEECGQTHDRDHLAALNIKRFALAEVHLSSTAGQAGSARGDAGNGQVCEARISPL